MTITSGNYELVASGQVIQIDDNPIKITLPDEIEGDFSFLITFTQKVDNPQILTTFNQIDKFLLQIDFVNFQGQVNVGNTSPICLGTLRELPLYLNYRVTDLANVGKTLTFNFYTKKEVANVS